MKQLLIQDIKNIVEKKSYLEHKFPDVDYTQTPEEIDEEIRQYGGKINGTVIDMQTANMLSIVYDALSKENKEKFETMLITMRNFTKLVDFGWKQVK